jgi:hypothetical protein
MNDLAALLSGFDASQKIAVGHTEPAACACATHFLHLTCVDRV